MPEFLGICIPKENISELLKDSGLNMEESVNSNLEGLLDQHEKSLQIICFSAASEQIFRKIISWKYSNLFILLIREEGCS